MIFYYKKQKNPIHNWNLDDVIISDSGSAIKRTLMNPDLATNIKPINNNLHPSTNAGTNKMTLQGDVKTFGDVWYDTTQKAKIFGLSHLSDKHRIAYNNWKEDTFTLYAYDEIFKFNWTNEGLYDYRPSYAYVTRVSPEKIIQPPPTTEINNMVATLK